MIQVHKQTDKDYLTAKGEEIQKPSLLTLEIFLLEIVIDILRESSDSDEPSLEEIGQAFNELSSVSSLNGNEILISKKTEGEVSKLVKIIEKEARLYKHLLFGELEET